MRHKAVATGTAGGGFPTTDLFARYEAKDETGYTDGDSLATIVDQFGANDLTQGTGLIQPKWDDAGLNGEAVYGLNRANNFASATVSSTEVRSVAVLASSGAAEATSRSWPFVANTSTTRILGVTEGEVSGEWGSFVRSDSATAQNASSGVDTTAFCLLVVTWDGSTALLYRNGSQIDSDSVTGSALAVDTIAMGRQPSISVEVFLGDIAMAAVWTSTLDTTAIDDLSTYCQSVYGVG